LKDSALYFIDEGKLVFQCFLSSIEPVVEDREILSSETIKHHVSGKKKVIS